MSEPAVPEPWPAADTTPISQHVASSPRAWRRRRVVVPTGVVVTAVVTVTGLAVTGVIGGPSYPHPWCGPVLAEMHARNGTEQKYEAVMVRLQQQDHAPVGTLLADLYAYDAAYAAEQSGNNFTAINDITGAMSSLNKIGADFRVLNRDCGQPANAYKHDTF